MVYGVTVILIAAKDLGRVMSHARDPSLRSG